MKLTKIEYPKPIIEYFAVRATNDPKAMKKEFNEITGYKLSQVVKLDNHGDILYFYDSSDIERNLYEYLIVTKITKYIYGKLHISYDFRLMNIWEFDVTFNEVK